MLSMSNQTLRSELCSGRFYHILQFLFNYALIGVAKLTVNLGNAIGL